MARHPWRPWPGGQRLLDRTLVVVLLFPVLVMSVGMRWEETLFSFAQIAPLLWRRHRPALVFTLVAAASAVQVLVLLVPVWGQIAFPIALYSVARFGTPRQGLAALGVGLLGGVVGPVRWLDSRGSLDLVPLLSYVLAIAAMVVAAWALGDRNRVRADLMGSGPRRAGRRGSTRW